MSKLWEASSTKYKRAQELLSLRINALTYTAAVLKEFDMMHDALDLDMRAMILMTESIQLQIAEHKRTGVPV